MTDIRIPVSQEFVRALHSAYGDAVPQSPVEAEVILRIKDGPEQVVPGCLVTEMEQQWIKGGAVPSFCLTVYGELPRD